MKWNYILSFFNFHLWIPFWNFWINYENSTEIIMDRDGENYRLLMVWKSLIIAHGFHRIKYFAWSCLIYSKKFSSVRFVFISGEFYVGLIWWWFGNVCVMAILAIDDCDIVYGLERFWCVVLRVRGKLYCTFYCTCELEVNV